MTDIHFADSRFVTIRLAAAAMLRVPVAAATAAAARIAAAARHRRDAAVLMSLSDADLKDIGISRAEIQRAVRTGRRP